MNQSCRRAAAALLLTRADFRSYWKVMLDQPEVAFQTVRMRRINREMVHHVTEDAAQNTPGQKLN